MVVLTAEVPRGELDGVSGSVGVHVDLKALCSGIIRRFDLDGDELSDALNAKIDLGSTPGLPILGFIAVYGELYIDVVLSHASLKVIQIFYHIEDIICRPILLAAEQP